ncbi:Sec-independent protein translocase protein TatCy [Lysinibacillus alkalisoli]|uniref:Sec-independent protein translocase protein TatC n=1 Tax=Lysinibacillus alkalisoli TaxID=1911548 RepID=A0A917G9F5_9BACI|nr:twin-arginine translocase subunit TatC [Lysinibacillus alkalisoli]GGG31101.1 Sec-independent protein translocase protein TatCy [Lysinibacillus alkalisoli]
MNQQELTMIEHIEELRKRLVISAVFFVLSLIGSFFLAKPLIKYLQDASTTHDLQLHAFNVTAPLMIYVQMTLLISLIITSPIILYQIWAFVSPGLRDVERRATLSYIPYAFLLFLAGLAFSYFILFPYMMKFMTALSTDLEIQQTIGIEAYFSFLFRITIPFGLLFQLPIIMLFLSRIGLLNPAWMTKFRKYAYFVLFVIAALITPPELLSHLIVTVPLFILYEISIVVARYGYRKYLKSEEARQKEEYELEQQRIVEEALAKQQEQLEAIENEK